MGHSTTLQGEHCYHSSYKQEGTGASRLKWSQSCSQQGTEGEEPKPTSSEVRVHSTPHHYATGFTEGSSEDDLAFLSLVPVGLMEHRGSGLSRLFVSLAGECWLLSPRIISPRNRLLCEVTGTGGTRDQSQDSVHATQASDFELGYFSVEGAGRSQPLGTIVPMKS